MARNTNSSRQSSESPGLTEWNIIDQLETDEAKQDGVNKINNKVDKKEDIYETTDAYTSGVETDFISDNYTSGVETDYTTDNYTSGVETDYETDNYTSGVETDYENTFERPTQSSSRTKSKRSSNSSKSNKSYSFAKELKIFINSHPSIYEFIQASLGIALLLLSIDFSSRLFSTLKYGYYDFLIETKTYPFFGLPNNPVFTVKHEEKCNLIYQNCQNIIDNCYYKTSNMDKCLVEYISIIDQDAKFCKWNVESILHTQKDHLFLLSFSKSIKNFADSSKDTLNSVVNDYVIGGSKKGVNYLSQKMTKEELNKGVDYASKGFKKVGEVFQNEYTKEAYDKTLKGVDLTGKVIVDSTKQGIEYIKGIDYHQQYKDTEKYIADKFASWF